MEVEWRVLRNRHAVNSLILIENVSQRSNLAGIDLNAFTRSVTLVEAVSECVTGDVND